MDTDNRIPFGGFGGFGNEALSFPVGQLVCAARKIKTVVAFMFYLPFPVQLVILFIKKSQRGDMLVAAVFFPESGHIFFTAFFKKQEVRVKKQDNEKLCIASCL